MLMQFCISVFRQFSLYNSVKLEKVRKAVLFLTEFLFSLCSEISSASVIFFFSDYLIDYESIDCMFVCLFVGYS